MAFYYLSYQFLRRNIWIHASSKTIKHNHISQYVYLIQFLYLVDKNTVWGKPSLINRNLYTCIHQRYLYRIVFKCASLLSWIRWVYVVLLNKVDLIQDKSYVRTVLFMRNIWTSFENGSKVFLRNWEVPIINYSKNVRKK